MYTYSQLISKNIISAAVLSVIFIAIAFFLTANDAKQKHIIQQKMINAYFTHTSTQPDAINSLATSLMKSQQFAFLQVNNLTDENIFQASHKVHWLADFLSPKKTQQTLPQKELTVAFQIDTSVQAQFLLNICISMVVLSFLFVFIAGKFSALQFKSALQAINEQIKNQVSHALNNPEDEKESDQLALFVLPELKASIAEMKAKINHHISDSGALAKEAYIEPVTELENRTRFVQYFENKNAIIDFGVLTITRCSELQTINQIHGYSEGDNYICKVAEILKKACTKYQSAKIFRLNSSDFATILPNTTLKDAENYAQELTEKFNQYQQSSDLDSVGYTGLVYFDKSNPLGELLALADTGISVAQTQQLNAWYAQTDSSILESSSATYGNQNWRQEIDNVLTNQRVILLIQHIKPTSRNAKVYGEVLARFLNANNEMLPTASFVAMAEKLDKIVDVDRMIIERTITEISEKNLYDQSFGINISARTIHDDHFLIWLERRLLKDPTIASQLIFEISEYGLQQNIKTSKRFVDMIHRVGSRVTVERFGVGLTSFKFFRDLKPDFIKMDSTYTRDIDEDKNNQYFLRLMVDLAHRLSITVLAESVESQEEKFTLEKLFIDGCQGFYIGKPEQI